MNKIFRFAYDAASSAFYVVGELKNKNEDKVRPILERVDFDGQSFTIAWAEAAEQNGGRYGPSAGMIYRTRS